MNRPGMLAGQKSDWRTQPTGRAMTRKFLGGSERAGIDED
jgi:hypothetical protein